MRDVQRSTGSFTTSESLDPITLSADDELTARVDVDYRWRKTLHHSATHLMHAALKSVIGAHVEQKGSVVEDERLRFDFSHAQPLTIDELNEVERWVNERIRLNEPVVIRDSVPIEEAQAEGAMALFGEKYGDEVRTIRAGRDS